MLNLALASPPIEESSPGDTGAPTLVDDMGRNQRDGCGRQVVATSTLAVKMGSTVLALIVLEAESLGSARRPRIDYFYNMDLQI